MLNIVINTFKEIVRNKFLYLIIAFWIVFIFFSIFLWKLSIWDDEKIIVDFWIAMIEIFGLVGVIFIWSQLLFKEIDWKTIFLILSKPIKRYEFILWKFLWFSLVVFIMVLVQSLIYISILFFNSIEITSLILISLFFILLKLLILIWLVIFLSTFISTILTIIISILVYFIWHMYSLILDHVNKIWNEVVIFISKIIQIIIPPFEALNTKDYIWSMVSFDFNYIIFNSFYSIFYLFITLALASIIFNKKTFEN